MNEIPIYLYMPPNDTILLYRHETGSYQNSGIRKEQSQLITCYQNFHKSNFQSEAIKKITNEFY